MTKLTIQNTMKDMEQIPELREISRYLIYVGEDSNAHEDFANMPIAAVRETGWSPEGIVSGMNFLVEQFEKGARPYFIYSDEECADDPQKTHVNIVRLTPETVDSEKPYIVLTAGGGYMGVCSAVEAYPTAVHMVNRGYQVFVLTYRIGEMGIMPKPLDDLAAALKFIRDHAEEFQVNPDNYAVGGFSAGANLVSTWGTTNVGYAVYGMAKPKAMFPVYTVVNLKALEDFEEQKAFLNIMLGEGYTQEKLEKYNVEQNVNGDYPPCYIVCGKDDSTVPCANSERLKERLDEYGVPAILNEGEHAQHGFGDGTGTDVEGWPEAAIDFLESL